MQGTCQPHLYLTLCEVYLMSITVTEVSHFLFTCAKMVLGRVPRRIASPAPRAQHRLAVAGSELTIGHRDPARIATNTGHTSHSVS